MPDEAPDAVARNFSVKDVRIGVADSAGNHIDRVYLKVEDLAIYRASRVVCVQFSDDVEQRKSSRTR
ncbi:hypothetical protein [Jiella sp. M17.18]|uniref:hypothetical protein n=1 Tax=Jiella sp. M17.18 TaxID=3234247 RepID=UPI0034DEA334